MSFMSSAPPDKEKSLQVDAVCSEKLKVAGRTHIGVSVWSDVLKKNDRFIHNHIKL